MSRKAFNYSEISTIEINGPASLLERIAENIEGEITENFSPDCRININQSKNPVEIKKDKRFPYLTVNKSETEKQPIITYIRYNTHVRTINQRSFNHYEVDTNVIMDEASGLICVRNYLINHPKLLMYPLLHSSLLNIDEEGVLIPGYSRQGKTALAVYLLERYGAGFVSDENTMLSLNEGDVKGLYIPRTPRVRFSTIAESGLSKALDDIKIANATQYIDSDAIEKIVSTRSFHVDAGIAFSRRAFCDLLGAYSLQSSTIDVVLFPKYKEEGNLEVRMLNFEEGMQRLSRTGLIKKLEIDPKELQETTISLEPYMFRGIEFIEVAFSGIENLKRGGFRL